MIENHECNKGKLEYLRTQGRQIFDKVRGTWIDCGQWALPHRIKWLLSQTQGERNNQYIVDPTHIMALRSYVAGFLEGNTSASRPWYRIQAADPDSNQAPENKRWLELYTKRTLDCLGSSNFYHSAGTFYYDFGTFNTGAHYIDELKGSLFFHNLIPGAYTIINNGFGEAVVLIREFSLGVKALVDTYGKIVNGKPDWSNFSKNVRKMYEDGNYSQTIDCVHVIKENSKFDTEKPIASLNKKWIQYTYEAGSGRGPYYQQDQQFGQSSNVDPMEQGEVYLKVSASKRKPFIVGVSDRSGNFEYGEKGPTSDALGLIKSLNKKAISKDLALEQMLKPPLQGPANLKKSYISSASNTFVPLDPTSAKPGGGLRTIFEVNPAIGSVIQDVNDLRQMVEKLYYADYLLYLSQNPRTRTATETNAIVQEQQMVIGPNLQSLNWTYNVPVVEFVMDYVLDEDPYLPPPPPALAGQFLRTEFISVFAQAQKAADLPAVERYMAMIEQVGSLPGGAHIWDKPNLDKLADIYEDRLYLPEGLNNPQNKVDAMRQQAQAAAQRQQALQQTLPAVAGAAKNVGLKAEDLGLKQQQ